MTPSPERLVVKCAVCGPADAEELVHLLGEVFSQRAPPAVAVGLTPSEFEALVRLFGSRVVAKGLTCIARRSDTGAMIGALMTEATKVRPPSSRLQTREGQFSWIKCWCKSHQSTAAVPNRVYVRGGRLMFQRLKPKNRPT